MQKQKNYFLILILILSVSNVLEARKITLKSKNSSSKSDDSFGGPYFSKNYYLFKIH